MRSVSYRLVDLNRVKINLGFQGENEHTQVLFDCKKAFEQYPSAIPTLEVTSPHGEKYPAITTREGDYVSWVVTSSDTAYHGEGKIQLSFVQNGKIMKSYRAKTFIEESINASGNPPSGVENWLETANQTLEELPTTAKQYALSALDEMTVEAETLPEGSDLEVVKTVDPDTGAINLDFKIPAGGGGTSDYEELENKPTLGGVTLNGDVSLQDIGAYEKPSSGIPAEDIAEGVIPDVTGKANLTVIAPAFNQATANDAGSFVTYEGVVYLLPDGHTAGTTWANTTKTATNIGEQLAQVKTDITKLTPAATNADIGKALIIKTVENGVPSSYEYGDATVDPEDIAEAVDDWLDENITNPDSPPLDRSLSSSSSAAPADIMGELMEHESFGLDGSDEPTVEYIPVEPDETVNGVRDTINAYGVLFVSSPTSTNMKIYPVTSGKTYKVIGYSDNTTNRPILAVAGSKVTSGTIADANSFEYVLGTESSAQAQETEYTALRTGYMYVNTNSSCGVWEKIVTPAPTRQYYMDEIRNVNMPLITSGLNKSVFREKTDSATALIKQVPHNAESIAKVTSIADTVTLVRSIVSRNLANKNAVGDVTIDSEGTTKKGIKTIKLPAGKYYINLGGMGSYVEFKKYEHGVFSTKYYSDQSPMQLSITDPSGGYFVVYASDVSKLGDMSTLIIAKMEVGESSVAFEAYSEKTYTPETLETNPYIEVKPNSFLEFVNSGNTDVSSTVKYLVSGKDDNSTTSKDFMVSPNGTKYLPMVKNDGTMALARVVPKKALFIGNSLTSGWQTFGEAATDSDNDFVANFSNYILTLDNAYTFNRIWATGYEVKTTLSEAQSWATTNIDPYLSNDLDLIVVQLSDNVTGTTTGSETFSERSLWLLQHLRENCPNARVVWMGVWFDRGWIPTLLENTKKTGCEYIDIQPLYLPENVSEIGSLYTMDADFTKSYDVDSFSVSNGQITLVFTVDGVQYTSTITSYTSYTSSGETQISVTGIYQVVSTYYASIHPGDEGFRKIANKMLFDLGIVDSEEAIPAST